MNYRKLFMALVKALAVVTVASAFVGGLHLGPDWISWIVISVAAAASLTTVFYWNDRD